MLHHVYVSFIPILVIPIKRNANNNKCSNNDRTLFDIILALIFITAKGFRNCRLSSSRVVHVKLGGPEDFISIIKDSPITHSDRQYPGFRDCLCIILAHRYEYYIIILHLYQFPFKPRIVNICQYILCIHQTHQNQ